MERILFGRIGRGHHRIMMGSVSHPVNACVVGISNLSALGEMMMADIVNRLTKAGFQVSTLHDDMVVSKAETPDVVEEAAFPPEPPLPPFKLYHYHLYDSSRRPIMSVCLLEHIVDKGGNSIYFRGVALCNPLDYGVLKNTTGKKLARERAIEGFTGFLAGVDAFQLCQNTAAIESYSSAIFNVKGEKVQRWIVPLKVNSHPCILMDHEKHLIQERKVKSQLTQNVKEITHA